MDERIEGPCDLIVKIVSPKYHRKDHIEKVEICRNAGVLHYWIVDLEEDFIEAYKLDNHAAYGTIGRMKTTLR